jgi:hypothetical protein
MATKPFGLDLPSSIKLRKSGGPSLTDEEKESNKLNQRLSTRRFELCRLLDDRIFIQQSLKFAIVKVTVGKCNSHVIKDDGPDQLQQATMPLHEEIRNVERRIKDILLTRDDEIGSLRALNRYLLSQASHALVRAEFPEKNTPELFFRVIWKNKGYTRFDKDFGFRSSNPLAPPDFQSPTLLQSPFLDADMLQTQCSGNGSSSLIGLFGNPLRLLNYTRKFALSDLESCCVAVIDASKLIQLGVLFNRTTTLADHLGRENYGEDGLQYAHRDYWVAYRWVPAESILRYISLTQLQHLRKTQVVLCKRWFC